MQKINTHPKSLTRDQLDWLRLVEYYHQIAISECNDELADELHKSYDELERIFRAPDADPDDARHMLKHLYKLMTNHDHETGNPERMYCLSSPFEVCNL